MKSPAMTMFLGSFKAAAAEGAVVELKLRLPAGKIPALQKYAHQYRLQDIETEVMQCLDRFLSPEEKDTLRLCRELRNKVLHSDFRAARDRLNQLGVETSSGGVKRLDVSGLSTDEIIEKLGGLTGGTEGTLVANTTSTEAGSVFGWFLEAGSAGDFQKATEAFQRAVAIVDKLIGIETP